MTASTASVRCDFSYSHFITAIRNFREAGYEILSSGDPNFSPRALRLVHDVDFFVEPALRMAVIEAEAGVHSTYFFRIFARGYNFFSAETQSAISRIEDCGHSVGIHFEPKIPYVSDLESNIEAEEIINAAETLARRKFQSRNLHEPTRQGFSESPLNSEYDFSYLAARHSGFKYLSDSGGRWRESCFCNWIGVEQKLLVLTHPIWWFTTNPNESY